MAQVTIDKPISESLETAGVKESRSMSGCIAPIMNALDDLLPLIADNEHITAEVNKDGCKVSVLKGESFAGTSAALMSKQKGSGKWETIVCDNLLAMICQMADRRRGGGESSLVDSVEGDEC